MAIKKLTRSVHRAQPRSRSKRKNTKKSQKLAPGSLALLERHLPGRRFVHFPQVQGKTVTKLEFFTCPESNSLTLEFTDQTSLVLEIEPGFTIHAELVQDERGELTTLAEWRDIRSQK